MVVIKTGHQAAQVPLHFVSTLDIDDLIYSWVQQCATWFGGCVRDKAREILFMASVFRVE